MSYLAMLLVAVVAALHFFFAYKEMFDWDNMGRRMMRTDDQSLIDKTAVLAANQGLYNALFGLGLIWALVSKSSGTAVLFLVFILAAGLYGGKTASPLIYVVQAVPAAIALIAIWLF